MKRSVLAIVVLSLLSWPFALEADETGWRRYFPLGAGSSWVYSMTHHGKETRFTTRVKGSRFIEPLKRKMVIVDEDQLGEHLPVGYFEDGDGFLNRFVHLEYVEGLAIASEANGTSQRILPADPGTLVQWESREMMLGVRHLWRSRLKRGAVVDVPAGRFGDCLVVESAGLPLNEGVQSAMRPLGRYRFKDWYAPGVGLVRSESHNDRQSEGPEVVSVLTEYNVVEAARGAE